MITTMIPKTDAADAAHLDVFVYGTLLPGQINYQAILQGKTTVERPASLRGARMWANGDRHRKPGTSWPFPFVALTGDHRDQVSGCVLRIEARHAAEVLSELDELETYRPGDPTNRYERLVVEVDLPDGGHVTAYVYVAAAQVRAELAKLPRVPHGDWLRYLTETDRSSD